MMTNVKNRLCLICVCYSLCTCLGLVQNTGGCCCHCLEPRLLSSLYPDQCLFDDFLNYFQNDPKDWSKLNTLKLKQRAWCVQHSNYCCRIQDSTADISGPPWVHFSDLNKSNKVPEKRRIGVKVHYGYIRDRIDKQRCT